MFLRNTSELPSYTASLKLSGSTVILFSLSSDTYLLKMNVKMKTATEENHA
jgi:hypothetical protein